MGEKSWLGEFEQIVMFAVMRLGTEAYGFAVQQEILQRTGRKSSLGSIYTTLDRMEQKGFVSSWVGEPTAERGGRAKKFFRVEGAGKAALQDAEAARRSMSTGFEPVFGG